MSFEVIPWVNIIIEKKNSLGQGASAVVVRAKWKKGKNLEKVVAVKLITESMCFNKGVSYEEERTSLISEAEVLQQSQTKGITNVLRFYGVVEGDLDAAIADKLPCAAAENEPAVGLVLEHTDAHPLSLLLYSRPSHPLLPLSIEEKLHILHEVAIALSELHSSGIIHGDLKPQNILVSAHVPRLIYLIDFGLSKIREGSALKAFGESTIINTVNLKGTMYYCAPGEIGTKFFLQLFVVKMAILEMLRSLLTFSPAAASSRLTDVYAFAILAWEVLARQVPFANDPSFPRAVVEANHRPSVTSLPRETPASVIELIETCWHEKREVRKSAMECVSILNQEIEKMKSGSFDIFFSHAWRDKPFLSHVDRLLCKAGFRVWYDQTEMGHDLKQSMAGGIYHSRVVLVCLNEYYTTRENCVFEIEEAVKQGKPIVVLLMERGIEQTTSNRVVQLCRLKEKLYVDMSELASNHEWRTVGSGGMSSSLQKKLAEALQPLISLIRTASDLSFPAIESEMITNGKADMVFPEQDQQTVVKGEDIEVLIKNDEEVKFLVQNDETEVKSPDSSNPQESSKLFDQLPYDAAEQLRKDREEIAKSSDYEMSKFSKLRSAEDFARGAILNKSKIVESFLTFQPTLIHKSLTDLDKESNKLAIQTFKDLLGYMGDKQLPNPSKLAEDFLRTGYELPPLRDELYLQIMKQLTLNPQPSSLSKGWQVMCMAVGTFKPSPEFENFLMHFLLRAKYHGRGAVLDYASYCVRTLHALLASPDGAAGFVPSIEEIEAYKDRPPILATIYLVDGNIITENLPLTPDLNVQKVLEMCTGWLDLKDARVNTLGLFLYDLGDNGENTSKESPSPYADLKRTPKPLRNTDYLGDQVIFMARQQRRFKFVLKGKIFLPSQVFKGTDPFFERMMYLQAEDEVLIEGNLPIDQQDDVVRLAAISMGIAYGEEMPSTVDELIGIGILDHIPPDWRSTLLSRDWAQLILQHRDRVIMADPEDLQEEFLQVARKHPMYGSHWFFVHLENNPSSLPTQTLKQLPVDLLISFNSEGMHLFTFARRHLVSIPYADIIRWNGLPDSTGIYFVIESSNFDETYELKFITALAGGIGAIVLDYIEAIMKGQE